MVNSSVPVLNQSIVNTSSGVLAGCIVCFAAFLFALQALSKRTSLSPLAFIPGPPSPSYLTGHYKLAVINKDGVKFCMDLSDNYGGVVKLKGFLGVSMLMTRVVSVFHICLSEYRAICYISLTHLHWRIYKRKQIHGLKHREFCSSLRQTILDVIV
jgi:hypothetical protein